MNFWSELIDVLYTVEISGWSLLEIIILCGSILGFVSVLFLAFVLGEKERGDDF